MTRKQMVGRVFGPKREIKVLAEAGKDESRHRMAWVFCRRCSGLKTMRFDDLEPQANRSRRGNQSCGCLQDEAFQEIIRLKVRRIPAPVRLRMWAATQLERDLGKVKERFLAERRKYRIDKDTFPHVIRETEIALQEDQVHDDVTRWSWAVRAKRKDVEAGPRKGADWRRRGEFFKSELRITRKGEFVGEFAKEAKHAQSLLQEWGFITESLNSEVTEALRRRGFHINDHVELARWLLSTATQTQSMRTARRKDFLNKMRQGEPKSQTQQADPGFVDESWSPLSSSNAAD